MVKAPMDVSRVTSGVPPSALPHILGTGHGGGARREEKRRDSLLSSEEEGRPQIRGLLYIILIHYKLQKAPHQI
jgi:hypothetical protein